jgi:hypothetical protein
MRTRIRPLGYQNRDQALEPQPQRSFNTNGWPLMHVIDMPLRARSIGTLYALRHQQANSSAKAKRISSTIREYTLYGVFSNRTESGARRKQKRHPIARGGVIAIAWLPVAFGLNISSRFSQSFTCGGLTCCRF